MKQFLETKLEKDYRLWIEEQGGFCWKLLPFSQVGIPDRLVLLPGGVVIFVELKREGKKPRRIQKYIHDKLKELGFYVLVLDNHTQAAAQTNYIRQCEGQPSAPVPARWG